tara:strand:- start:990 stop:1160 length:171 start_codon:yes stop_codon:yes gene_type:complete
MEIVLLILVAIMLVASYFLFNIRASKKQTNRENRLNWYYGKKKKGKAVVNVQDVDI